MYRRPQRMFGSKQPPKASQEAALRTLVAGCRDLDKLPAISTLAGMYRCDPRLVETLIGAERRRRVEAVTTA